MQLKTYQNTVLEILSKYLRYAKETDPEIAFQKIHKEFPERNFKPSYKSIKEAKTILEITKLENGNTIITSKDVISEDLKNAIVSQIPEEVEKKIYV